MKWPKSNQMVRIHVLDSIVLDYVIYNILIRNEIVNFDILMNMR
jgi:hypothetical protein